MDDYQEKLAIDGGHPVRRQPLAWPLPGVHWLADEEVELVQRVIRAKSPFRFYGPNVVGMADLLEEQFRTRLNRGWALATGSCTSALYVALSALGIGSGDEVLLPGYSWVSCISAIVRCGAIPKLVDIDQTYCMAPIDLETKIGPRSKAVLLVHMNGSCGRLDSLLSIARKSGLAVVEDVAQANGGSFRGQPLGSFGDLAVFSLQANKTVTCGEGGIIVGDSDKYYEHCFAIHDLGYPPVTRHRKMAAVQCPPTWGVGTRMDELTAAVAVGQMRKLDRIVAQLRCIKKQIVDGMCEIGNFQLREIIDPEGDTGNSLILLFQFPEACRQFVMAVRAEGIDGPADQNGHCDCPPLIPMSDLGLHWYFNNKSLVEKVGVTPDGQPWTHPSNQFATTYHFEFGTLPMCDQLSARSAVLAISSVQDEIAAHDVVVAIKKVASKIGSMAASPRIGA